MVTKQENTEGAAQAPESPTMGFLKKGKTVKAEKAVDSGGIVATSEVVAAKPAEVAKEAVKAPKVKTGDVINDTAVELEKLTKDEALKEAHNLLDGESFSDFKLGGLISIIQTNGFWEGMGYEKLQLWISGELDGMDYRKAMHLKDIYNNLVTSGVDWNKIKKLGWTKLIHLSGVMTKENVDEWVDKCKAPTTVLQIAEMVKVSKMAAVATGTPAAPVATPTASETISTFTVKLHADQREIINAAVASAMADIGTEFPAVALTTIAETYLENKTGKPVKGASLEELMKDAGWEKTLEVFGGLFPKVDLTVEATGEEVAA